MDKHILLLTTLSISYIFSAHFRGSNSAIISCNQTPYPELCNSLVDTKPQQTLDENPFDFRDMAIGVTLDQAQNAHKLISTMNISSFNEQGKSAWVDCLEHYEDTIYQLKRSITSRNPTSMLDAQTWLSAAIANEQACKNGFKDFNLSSHLETLPKMLSNYSKFLRNSLAINKAIMTSSSFSSEFYSTHHRRLLSDGFPEWLSTGDRKLLQSFGVGTVRADIVVAQDGSGNYMTISEALGAIPKRKGKKRLVVYVKKGVYRENVEIKKSLKNLMFIGDGIDATIITGNKNVQDGSTTFHSATFAISGEGFIARGITFENTAGPEKSQAVALRSGSDFSVFHSCSFKGYQDTLYVYSQRQFYRDCDIYGTVDFIFGDAVAVLQNCNIYVRKPTKSQTNTVTAQGRSDPTENTGIVIHNSRVIADTEFRGFQSSIKTYLGRPWKKYSRTVFLKCEIDGLVDSDGWVAWRGSFALSTLYYGEYMNSGSGASTGGRVNWPGYHVITQAAEAGIFSVGNFLDGDAWLPETGVPFTSGL